MTDHFSDGPFTKNPKDLDSLALAVIKMQQVAKKPKEETPKKDENSK